MDFSRSLLNLFGTIEALDNVPFQIKWTETIHFFSQRQQIQIFFTLLFLAKLGFSLDKNTVTKTYLFLKSRTLTTLTFKRCQIRLLYAKSPKFCFFKDIIRTFKIKFDLKSWYKYVCWLFYFYCCPLITFEQF